MNKCLRKLHPVRNLFASLLIFLGVGLAHAQENDTTSPRITAFAYLEDTSGALTFAQVHTKESGWSFVTGSGISKGFSQSTFWLRLELSVPVGRAIFTALPTFLDDVRFYVPQSLIAPQDLERYNAADVTRWFVSQQGDFFSKVQRGLDWRGFSLDLKPQVSREGNSVTAAQTDRHTIFVRFNTSSTSLIDFDIYGERDFQSKVSRELLVFGLVIGGALSFALTGLFFLAIEARRQFRYYLFFSLSCVLWYLAVNGFISQFFFQENPVIASHILGFISCAVFGSVVLLMRAMLEPDLRTPIIDHFLKWSALAQICLAPFAFLDWYRFIAEPNMALALLQWAAFLFIATSSLKSSKRTRLKILLVLMALISLNSVMLLGFLTGLIPSEMTLEIMQAVLFLDLLMLLPMLLVRTESVKTELQIAKNSASLAMERLELQQSAREEQLKWVQMITHELKTPITIIDAARQMLAKTVTDEPSTERLEKMSRAVQRLTGLIDSFVLEDEISGGHRPMRKTKVGVQALLATLETLLTEETLSRLDIRSSPSTPAIEADQDLLIIALSNLVTNAARHSPANSEIILEIRPALIAGQQAVEFVVSNLGQPILVSDQQRLFQRFSRLGHTAGSGMGLWAVREIATAHGGYCDYQEEPFGETGLVRHIFRLTLPNA